MFPLTNRDNDLYTNVDVLVYSNGQFVPTGDRCMILRSITRENGFRGVVHNAKYPDAMDIVLEIENDDHTTSYIIDRFFCIKCFKLRSRKGGNQARHYSTFCRNMDPFTQYSDVTFPLFFLLSHGFPMSRFDLADARLAFPFYPCYDSIMKIFENLKDRILQYIKHDLINADNIVLEADGWSHPSKSRLLGVVIKYIKEKELYQCPVALVPTPLNQELPKMDSDSMLKIIQGVIGYFETDVSKLLSLCSDSAADMIALCRKLGIDWDRCLLHLLQLQFKIFWDSTAERIDDIIRIVSNLQRCKVWIEYIAQNRDKYPEIGRCQNIKIGCPTRWGSYIDELSSLVTFKKTILAYQAAVFKSKHKNKEFVPDPANHLLESDFLLINDVLPLMQRVRKIIAHLEGSETPYARFYLAFEYIYNDLLNFMDDHIDTVWYQPALVFAQVIHNEVIESTEKYIMNAKAAVVLDGTVTSIPMHLLEQIESVKDYIRNQMNTDVITVSESQPVPSVEENDILGKRYCMPARAHYSDELGDWIENHRVLVTTHAITYWQNNTSHPAVRDYALKLFLHSGTSVACERFFSICRYISSDNQQSMTLDHFTTIAIILGNKELAKKILKH